MFPPFPPLGHFFRASEHLVVFLNSAFAKWFFGWAGGPGYKSVANRRRIFVLGKHPPKMNESNLKAMMVGKMIF